MQHKQISQKATGHKKTWSKGGEEAICSRAILKTSAAPGGKWKQGGFKLGDERRIVLIGRAGVVPEHSSF